MKTRNGFTLVELMGFLALVGILAALIFPRAFNVVNDAKNQSLSMHLVTNVGLADLSESIVVDVPAQKIVGVEMVGNMTFIRTIFDCRDDDAILNAMAEVDTFERDHSQLEITHRQMVLLRDYKVSFLLNHRPRETN